MKKFTLGLLIALTGVYSASARQITADEALSVASYFMSSSELKSAQSTSSALRPKKAPGVNVSPYYIFNRGENEGFVIVSGDDRAPKILGYSDKGTFESKNLPPQLKEMMEQWTAQMRQLPESVSQHQSWNNAMETRAGEGVLMETAEWGQGYPYNLKCPVFEGEQAMTGCTATAMAIVMKYHNWPEKTQGVNYTNYNHRDQTIDFSSQAIDWKSLEDSKDSGTFNKAASDLNYMLGVAIDTYYTSLESVADIWPVGHRMMEHFKYSPECQYVERKMFDDEKWHNMIKEQLDGGYPIIYNGSGGNYSVGHAFVIDGYSSDGLYHVNWGWDGSCNGYYPIDALIPDDRDFSQNAGMTINIIPDRSGKIYSRAFIPNAEVYLNDLIKFNDFNFSVSELKPGVSFKCMSPMMSYPYTDFEGTFGIAVVDKDDNIVEKLFEDDFQEGANSHRLCGCTTDEACKNPGSRGDWWNIEVPGLAEGQRYQIVCYDSKEQNPDWRIVTGGIIHPSYFGDSNLNSEICHVYVSKDDNAPIICMLDNPSVELGVQGEHKEVEPGHYEVLKGGPFGFWTMCGGGDVTYEVQSFDENGNEKDYIINRANDLGMYSMTLTVLESKNTIHIKFIDFENTKHDEGKDPSTIISKDNLVYETNDNCVSLIGYINADSESIEIPDYITVNDVKYPVTNISANAFSKYDGVKHVIIGKNVESVEYFSFSRMRDLEAISISSNIQFKGYAVHWSENIKNVYLTSSEAYKSDYWRLGERAGSNTIDFLNVYVSDIMFDNFGYGEYYLPGKGEGTDDENNLNHRMWEYAIDRKQNIIKIKPEIDEIKILSVLINGNPVDADENFIYEVPSTDDMEVKVNYILHDRQEMTTVYNAAYNKDLPDQSLTQGVKGINLSNENISIFTLDGVVVANSANESTVKTLTPGVYIIRQGNEMKKLVIR